MNWRFIKDVSLIIIVFFALIPIILAIVLIYLIAIAVNHHGDE